MSDIKKSPPIPQGRIHALAGRIAEIGAHLSSGGEIEGSSAPSETLLEANFWSLIHGNVSQREMEEILKEASDKSPSIIPAFEELAHKLWLKVKTTSRVDALSASASRFVSAIRSTTANGYGNDNIAKVVEAWCVDQSAADVTAAESFLKVLNEHYSSSAVLKRTPTNPFSPKG